jgi:threonine/homoserine/homoserine lactone efflux protein
MVAGTALEKGFKHGLILALTPLVTDVPPLLFSALLLERLGWTALTMLGISGGAVILVVGLRFLRRHGSSGNLLGGAHEGQSAHLGHVLASSLLNPSPWIFWLVVASPFLLRSWNRSTTEGITFVAVLFVTNISTASSLAWIASHSRKLLAPVWQRRALRVVGVTLVLVGALLCWQATVGNFQALIDQQSVIRSVVEEGLAPG